jgi:hypothetical protein
MVMNKVPYSAERLEQLKRRLLNAEAANNPNEYEIWVDGLPVVNRTDDIEQFDNYLYDIGENINMLTVKIYFGASNNNNQYSFEVNPQMPVATQPATPAPALNGLGELEKMVQVKMEEYKKEQERAKLTAKIEELEDDLEECRQYKDKLENILEQERKDRFTLKGVNLVEMGSKVLEGMVRRNPQWLRKLPVGDALAGFIEQDTIELERQQQLPATEEPAAEFKPKQPAPVDEVQRFHLSLLNELSRSLNQPQLNKLMAMLQRLSAEPALVEPMEAWLKNQ